MFVLAVEGHFDLGNEVCLLIYSAVRRLKVLTHALHLKKNHSLFCFAFAEFVVKGALNNFDYESTSISIDVDL